MESELWYVFGGNRGGPNRIRLVRALYERPRNPNQLAETLKLDYTTVRHHLDVLLRHDIVRKVGEDYGAVYELSAPAREHWTTIEKIDENSAQPSQA